MKGGYKGESFNPARESFGKNQNIWALRKNSAKYAKSAYFLDRFKQSEGPCGVSNVFKSELSLTKTNILEATDISHCHSKLYQRNLSKPINLLIYYKKLMAQIGPR